MIENRITGQGTANPQDLKANPANWRTHPVGQKALMGAVLDETGWVQQVIVNEQTGLVVDGHLRLEIALERGETEIPVIYVSLTPEEEALVLATYDPVSAMAGQDDKLLTSLIERVQTENTTVNDFLLSMVPPKFVAEKKNDKDPDDAPDVPEQAITNPGDIWSLGKHRLLCGDATSHADVSMLMGENKARCYLTDPPYNVAYKGTAGTIKNDNQEDAPFRAFLLDAFKAAYPCLAAGAAFYVWHADSEGYNFRGAMAESADDMHLLQCIVWIKNSLVMGRQDYHWKHEPCLFGYKGKDEKQRTWNGAETSVVEFDKPAKSKVHPTMKPVALIEMQMANSTNPGDIVLDSFLGSGTTLIAAERTDRICYGLELDPKYCDVIVHRWQEYTGKKATRQDGSEFVKLGYTTEGQPPTE